jgi:hypothetical protein
MHESILVYRKHRYLKWALALAVASAFFYMIDSPLGHPNGGTWLGYTLGTISGGLMVWLAWFGVRKRRYGLGNVPLEDWLSAHIYLGIALALIATLHAGFQLGFNIHSVLYILMMITIISGMVGLYFYISYPRLLTENRRGLSTEVMLAQIAELDRDLRQIAMTMDDATNAATLKATQDTIIGGTVLQQLRGHDEHCPTTQARLFVEGSEGGPHDTQRRQLLTRLIRKEDLLKRIRRDVQLRCLLKVWLYVHIPFSIAALAALVTHVVTVFYYW